MEHKNIYDIKQTWIDFDSDSKKIVAINYVDLTRVSSFSKYPTIL